MTTRAKDSKTVDFDKFLKLDKDKRTRIINAAMKEFRYGYKKASTDLIVKEAGISKGILFHYFGTKEQLYAFVVSYVLEFAQMKYFEGLDKEQNDILEILWQAALFKIDISRQYPYLHDFLIGSYVHSEDVPSVEINSIFEKGYDLAYEEMIARCDETLFRDDIDHTKAINILCMTIDGLVNDAKSGFVSGDEESYDKFLEELQSYLDIFRLTFYKNN